MAETYCNGEPELRSRIEYIIRNEWQGYELVSNISAGTFGAKDGARDYSYGIYHNGAPVAMIMILHDNNEYRRKAVRLSHEACSCQSIPCMNFMSYMANYPSYISDRFRETIRG